MVIGIRANRKDNSKRRFTGGGPRPDNRKHKQEEAKERAEAWQKLSLVQQLKRLDEIFGEGKGAKKQRAKIEARINRPKQVHAAIVTDVDGAVKAKDRRAAEQAKRPAK